MKYERYKEIDISIKKLEFQFDSEGPKGKIRKIIRFTSTEGGEVYNLVFGNLNDDGSIDCKIINDNKDRNKILATIFYIVYEFINKKPDKRIFFYGRPDRIRLYRMAISVNLEELKKYFEIFGVLKGEEPLIAIPFTKGIDYFGFLISKKQIHL